MKEINSVASAGDQPVVSNHEENTPLFPGRTKTWLAMRYGTTRKCVSNKAALLIFLWSFVVGLCNAMLLNPEMYQPIFVTSFSNFLIAYGVVVIFTCFFPLAGILADIKFGRYKTVATSLFIVLLALLLQPGVAVIIIRQLYNWWLLIVFSALGCILALLLYVGLIGFTANVVQFGMDQLHDSPAEDNTLFIHWYVWTYYASFFVVQLALNLGLTPMFINAYMPVYASIIGLCLLLLIHVVVVMVLAITLSLVRRRRRWFLIEPGGLNPYKLVYRVTKFARQHKIPVQRSDFTYCEDELPSGLDLGKEKYGGCFTTEQVEDVKAFYGILKVLFSFGLVFFLDFAANSILPLFAFHITDTYEGVVEFILFSTCLFSPLLIVICIPLYLCLLRPFISQYIPGMLMRMGLGMFLVLLSLMTSFFMDTAATLEDDHVHNNTICMLAIDHDIHYSSPHDQNPALLLIQLTLSALSHMLIYTAVFEFICSQSPYSMKGLLIGVLYAIRGLYQLVATFLVLLFALTTINLISCGFWYYLMNIVIGVVALLVYTCVAKRYRFRVRDEFCNIHQYAENYYSNQQYREEIRSDD